MPVESAPTLAPYLPPPVTAADPIRRLERLEPSPMARVDAVDPLLRAARGRVASLRLRARTAERAAEQAESTLAGHDAGSFEAEREARLAGVAAEADEARRRRDAAIAAAVEEVEALLATARAEAVEEVAAARRELHVAVAAVGVVPPVTAAMAGPSEEEADDEPPLPPAAAYPPPAPSSAPTVPPPGAPAPAPVLAAPYATPFSTVLLQAADGSLQPAIVLHPVGLPAGIPLAGTLPTPTAPSFAPAVPATVASTALVPVGPAAGAEPSTATVPAAGPAAEHDLAPSARRRLLHLDVILPLVAVLIVLVVLLAWLG